MSKVVNEARQQLIAAINAAKPGLKEFKIEVFWNLTPAMWLF